MPDVVEPGTRLVQRYRLEEHLGGLGHAGHGVHGTTYWRAHDELLDRPVGVCLLSAGHPHAEQVLRAARLAAALGDSRFLRVLDASEVERIEVGRIEVEGGNVDGSEVERGVRPAVYVVSEWVRATTLVDLLADGPLASHEAHDLAADVAGALDAAAAAGLAHLCLRPEHVLRTAHGQLKVAGLAVDAAARGVVATGAPDAARRDARAAAAVLYAALTARWPDGGGTGLAAAPYDGDALCSPRQVRAGVPDDLDDVVCRALDLPGRHHGDRRAGAPLRSPAELVAALAAAHATSRIPAVGPATTTARTTPVSSPPARLAPYEDQETRRGRPVAATIAWTVAALVLVAGLALFGGQLVSLGGGEEPGDSADSGTGDGKSASVRTAPLKVAGATTLDPPPDGSGDENPDRAGLAVDDDGAGSAWSTKTYDDPFSSPAALKDGVGLVLDLGRARDVAKVAVTVQGGATDLEVRVADGAGAPEALDGYRLVDQAANVFPRAVLRPDEPVRARYVLVWLTELPSQDGGYRGEVADVTVSG